MTLTDLPRGCIGPAALRALALRLDQLTDAHERAGGKPADAPCLVQLTARVELPATISDGRTEHQIIARVRSGDRWFQLRYDATNMLWNFL